MSIRKRKALIRVASVFVIVAALISVFFMVQYFTYRTKISIEGHTFHVGYIPHTEASGYSLNFYSANLSAYEFLVGKFVLDKPETEIPAETLAIINAYIPKKDLSKPRKIDEKTQNCEHLQTNESLSIPIDIHQRNGECISISHSGIQCADCGLWLSITTPLNLTRGVPHAHVTTGKCLFWNTWRSAFMQRISL